MSPFSPSHGAYGWLRGVSRGYDLPFDRLSTAIDERLLIGPFDPDLRRRGPWRLFKRNRRFIHRQAIVPGAVKRRKSFQLVERAFLLKDLCIGLDRDRRVEHAGDALHRDLLRHWIRRGI